MSENWDETDDPEERRRRQPLSNLAVFGFIVDHWTSLPWRFGAIVGLMAIATAADICIPWAAGRLVDVVSLPARKADLAWGAWSLLCGLYVVFYMVRSVVFRLTNSFYARNMEKMVVAAFERVQDYSSDWHANTFAGATVRRVSRSMWGFDAVSDATILMLGPTLVVLIGLALSIGLRWPVAGLFTAVLVTSFIIFNVTMTSRYIRPANLKSNALDSQIGAVLADAIAGNPAVKSFGGETREAARFRATTTAWRKAMVKTWNRFNAMGMGQNLLLLALQAGLTGLMLQRWSEGRATPGDLAFVLTSFMLMAGYLRNFGEIVRMMQRGLDDTMDVAAYMRQPPQVADVPNLEDFLPAFGAIHFEEVSFTYRGQSAAVYDAFDLTIRPGERVALVGPTGAGKSTFVKLLQRLYDIDGGRILVDGQDIARVRQADLRRGIAVVPQDPALFHRTIAENIAYARPDATAEEVQQAARRALADDFINRLPKGYDTLVGERGVKLSGGERQRVAIARAFLADAPILILDEATSSLDVETEQSIQSAIDALMRGRTTIVIAHRLSTISSADRILVFQNGRIIEEGRHAELLERGGTYARLSAIGSI
jgi:ATP-binding cassette subfamily B protein